MKRLLDWFVVSLYLVILTTSIASAGELKADLAGYWPLDGDVKDKISGKEGKRFGGTSWVDG